jgi:CheY-like chemotaxis protein
MLQQRSRDQDRDPCRVLLIAGESSVRCLISIFLSTMRCACVTVSTAHQLIDVQHESFDAVLIDMVNSGMPAEQAIVTARELYPSLSERILAFSSAGTDPEMVDVIERCGLYQIYKGTLLPQIWATLQEFVAGSRISRLAPPSIQLAELIFDSFRTSLPAGVRCSHKSDRHLAYRCKDKIVDLLITPHVESDRITLAGQVTGMGAKEETNDSLVVLLMDGVETVARTNTNQFGEFQLEFEMVKDVGLRIRLLDDSWAAIAIGKMDWARKRPPD